MKIDIDQLAQNVETAEALPTSRGRVDYDVEGMTAYGVWQIAMQTLAEIGYVDTGVTSQVFYNFASGGRINGQKKAKRFTQEEVEAFVPRFVKSYVKAHSSK